MSRNLTYKILKAHLVEGELEPGQEIAIRIDQTLTQDATGTMAYLQFEALGIDCVQTKLSVSYVDHNTLQCGYENADDHRYLQSVAAKHGIKFSAPGNGICHQVHLERFGIPGMTLLGSDSHTPTGGGIGMLAIGAGGLDVAVAMGGGAFYLTAPKVVGVWLEGKLSPWVSAKDVVLEVLRRLKVKGGVGRVIEYRGPGVATLNVPERATITNMGAELGATTSIFPSDDQTRDFMRLQHRGSSHRYLAADEGAQYDEEIEIDLSKLEPLVACPHSPDNVVEARKLSNIKLAQVAIGSCTNSSLQDLMMIARVLKGKRVHPETSTCLSPGSKQVLRNLIEAGGLEPIVAAGVRLLEPTCGPCIGMGMSPPSGSASLRTFNRNFLGRTGTKDAQAYLCSPQVAVASALTGHITDPRELGTAPRVRMPESLLIDDSMILNPAEDPSKVEVVRGPNIKPLPINKALPASLQGDVLLKVEDNITTDHIMPAGAKVLPLRSNIPAISEYVFSVLDTEFAARAREHKGGFVVGGENYGQGSSREHAALAPMYLGVKAVITKSFARIHQANLINFGILPLTFCDPAAYDGIAQNDRLDIPDLKAALKKGAETVTVVNQTKKTSFEVALNFSVRQREILLAGGLLNLTRDQQKKAESKA
ncbi:MAG TPA: aconitate hydratase [Candidatus Sumerlaeota bacterium]|nr:aconitate hydratase [Candidatus Sumerlaeota bacterium]